MIRAILTIININTSKSINGFLYYLKKIPGIKNLLKDINYSFIGFKKFLSIIGIISSIITGPLFFGLLFFAAIYLPANIEWVKADSLNALMFFIFSFFFLNQFIGSKMIEANQETFIVVKQMRMNPKVYAVSQTIWKNLRGLFSKALVFALFFKFILNKDSLFGVYLALSITMFDIFMDATHLYIFKKTGHSVNDFPKARFGLALLGIAGTYGIVMLTKLPEVLNLVSILTSTYLTIILSFLGILGFIYLLKYDRYWDIINNANKLETYKDFQESTQDINFQEVKLRDKDFDGENLKENENIDKEGYEYLNHIFFKRHKRVVYKPMIRKLLGILLVFLGIFIVDRFFVDGFGKTTTTELIDGFSLFIIIVYALCNSTAIMKSLFYNCDRSLLRYGFYKEGDALLRMFSLRLKKILFYNMIPITVLCLGLVQLIYFNLPERIGQAMPMIASTILLATFFSVHYIFVYYILQPFSTDLKIKNPLYNIINGLVYLVSYGFIGLGFSASQMLPYILGFTIIYVSLALLLVYKKAPKTFRVK
ncbi:MAG: hypothetical protein ACTHW2_05060 [Tissierella sp.]